MQASSSPVDLTLVLSLLYALVILGVILVILTALLRVQKGHSSSLRDVFRQSRFLELTTVLVIIISGTYLAISSKLSEGVVSLLSGIAGYVLGGLASQRPQQEGVPGSTAPGAAASTAAAPAGSPTPAHPESTAPASLGSTAPGPK